MSEYLDGRIATPSPETVEFLETTPADDEGAQALKKALADSGGKLTVLIRWHNHNRFYWVKFVETGDWAYPAESFTILD